MTDTDTKTPAAKTVAESMPARRVFATPEAAAAYLTESGGIYADFGAIPLAAPGIDEEGNFDPAVFTDSTEVMVAKLRRQGTADQKAKGLKPGISAIVVGAVPTLDSLMADPAGRVWVQAIIHKELNHVLVRPLRDAANVSTVIDEMPTTMAGFITSGRESGGGIMEAFNDLYKSVNEFLASKVPVWKRAKPSLIKSEFKRCLESSAYALEYFPALEDRGEGKDSLFVMALGLFVNKATKEGKDTAIFDRWLATRNEKAFDAEEVEDEDFDLESLTESLLDDTATETEAAAIDSTEGDTADEAE